MALDQASLLFWNLKSLEEFILIKIFLVSYLLKEGDLVLKKATEYGAVEIWMNERVRRACPSSCADFVYGFLEVLANQLHI